ncbi:MAG: hypothetical protein HW421_949 [Ignavibacteria bacterium]|nr:hypothetical protein [Ignavibacteria bacterium]
MKISRKLIIIAFATSIFLAVMPDLKAQGGGTAVPFLRISPDARASGMGEVGTAIADDINAIYWNPGGLGFLQYYELPTTAGSDEEPPPYFQSSIAYSPWLPQFNADLYYSYINVGRYFEELDGTVACNFIFMHLGEFIRTAVDGRQLGKFISNEFALGISYGAIVATDFGVGFQLKYIRSNLAPAAQGQTTAGTGQSGSFDLGLLWKPKQLDVFGVECGDIFSVGLNLQNVGPKMTYRSMSDPLPTTLRLGLAFKIFEDEFNDLKIAGDMSKLLIKRNIDGSSDALPKSLVSGWENPGAEFAFGLEYWYEKVVAGRFGYFTEPDALGGRKYYNFGAGVRYSIFRLDFSFINTIETNHPLANTMRFSMLVDFQ